MPIYLKQSTASQEIPLGMFLDSTDGNTEETALTIANTDIKLHKAGATTLANKNSGGGTHISNGIYYAVLDGTDTDTLGSLIIFVHVAGALAIRVECVVLTANIYDSLIGGSDLLDISVTQWLGIAAAIPAVGGVPKVDLTYIVGVAQSATDLKDFADDGYDPATNKVQGVVLVDTLTTYTGNTPQTGDSFARLGLPAGASVSVDIAAIEAQTDDMGAAGAGLTAIPWNAAWDAEVQSEVADALVAYDPPTQAELIAEIDAVQADVATRASQASVTTIDDFLDTEITAIKAVTDALPNAGALTTIQADLDNIQLRILSPLTTGTSDSGTTTTMVDAARTEADTDYWKGSLIRFTSGTISGQTRRITGFTPATDTITFAPPVTQAVGTQTYEILPSDMSNLDAANSTLATQASVNIIDDFLDTEIPAIKAVTDALPNAGALTTIQADLDDIQVKIGTPAGASVSADIAAIENQTDDIGVAGAGLTNIPWSPAWDAEVQSEVADALAVYDPPTQAELVSEINAVQADIAALNNLSAAQVNTEVDIALADVNLDHLVGTAAGIPAIVTGTYIDQMMDDGTAVYDRTTDSLQAIRDRGDTAWTTGGGGSLTDVLNIVALVPSSIDLANTATWRLALMLTNGVDDLPSTAEITPGTISIDRKAIGGTGWSAIVTDAACSESAGLIYYDATFNSGAGYAEGDSLRITFKSQKITVAANDYEISDSTGRILYSEIRQTERGTNSAALASSLATVEGKIDTIDNFVDTEITDIQARLPSSLLAGRMDSNMQAAANGVITALVIATDAIDSDAIAASAVTEIQANLATAAALQTVDDLVDDLETRLTVARAGYLDNLNIGGNVASSAEVVVIQNNTRVVRVVPDVMERPDSGSTVFRIELLLYDTQGNMEVPDSIPTLSVVNQAGTSRDVNLDSTTMSLVSTGRYRSTYTLDTAHALEELIYVFSVVEGGSTRLYANPSMVVDTTAVDFTAADRTKLDAIHVKLPSKTYLTGTANSDGDVQLDEMTGGLNATAKIDVNAEADQALIDYDAPTSAELVSEINTVQSDIAGVPAAVWAAGSRTLTSFGTLVADVATSVWAAATRLLTAGTNINLAKGIGVTGFNDLSAAQVNAEVDTALADANLDEFADLIELDGALYRFTVAALFNAPAGGGGGGGATAADVWTYVNRTLTSGANLPLPAALTANGHIKADVLAINGSLASAVLLALSAGTMVSGAAVAGTLSTTKMTTNLAETTNDHFKGRLITWLSPSTLFLQYSIVTDYDGVTKMLTYVQITEAPLAGDTFIIV